MISRNLPLLLLALVFIGLGSALFILAPKHVLQVPEEEPESVVLEDTKYFTGRMVMPSLDDFYVLDNSAGRNLLQFESFLQGRAAGLHWISEQHFSNEKSYARHHRGAEIRDVYMGLKLSVDSLGAMEPEILFCNTEDSDFKNLVLNHVKAYWRYPRSSGGKFEVWMPITWRANY